MREFDVLETKAEAELRRNGSGGGGGGGNRNYYSNNNQGDGGNNRGASFYVNDPDDEYDPRSGSDGGFFS